MTTTTSRMTTTTTTTTNTVVARARRRRRRVRKVYRVTGQLYYASIDPFLACFDVANDPPVVGYYDKLCCFFFRPFQLHVLFHHPY